MACIDSTFLGDGFVLRTVVVVSFMQQQYVGKLIGEKYEQNKNEMMMGYMQKKRKKKVDRRLTYLLNGLSRHFKGGKRRKVSILSIEEFQLSLLANESRLTPVVIVVGKVTAVSDSGWRCK